MGRKDIKLGSENEGLRSHVYEQKIKACIRLLVMQRAFDGVEKFLKGLSFWDKFKNRYPVQILNSIKSFNPSDMITILPCDNKSCKNHGDWWFVTVVSFMPATRPCKSTLRTFASQGLKATDSTSKQLCQKGSGINRRTKKYTTFDTNVRKLYFGVKSFYFTLLYPTVSFWFFS